MKKELVPVKHSNKNNFQNISTAEMEQIYPEISKHIQKNMEAMENIKVNFLERLEVLPESKA